MGLKLNTLKVNLVSNLQRWEHNFLLKTCLFHPVSSVTKFICLRQKGHVTVLLVHTFILVYRIILKTEFIKPAYLRTDFTYPSKTFFQCIQYNQLREIQIFFSNFSKYSLKEEIQNTESWLLFSTTNQHTSEMQGTRIKKMESYIFFSRLYYI